MNRLLANLGALLLSLILAVTVWVVAVQDENPIITADYQTPIPVTLRGPDAGLSIVNQPLTQVTLRLRAPRRTWEERLRAQDFIVKADLAGLPAGRHDVVLEADYPGDEVDILEIKPDSLVVTLEAITSRKVPVQVEVIGEPAFGYDWRSTTVTPTQVTITGTESVVNDVKNALVEVALRGARSTLERGQPVTLRNAQNEAVTAVLEVAPRTVQITVTIAQRAGYRDFSVRVPYTGAPAQGYQISGILVEPSLVTLRGSPSAFEELPGYVETMPIDLDNAVEDIRAQVALNLPESLAAVGLNSVGVNIQVDPILISRSYEVEPVIRGLSPGLTRTVPLRTVNVVVSGPMPLLDALDAGQVQVIADLSGLGLGVQQVPLSPVVPEGVSVVNLSPEQINITIAELPTPTPSLLLTVTITPTVTLTPAITPDAGGN